MYEFFWYLILILPFKVILLYDIKKPAAQAAGADPSQCKSTRRQNPPIQQNGYNFWTDTAILMPFKN